VDVFTTVVGILIAGAALFVGYRLGIKDGFRGGFQTGRTLERQLAAEERRYLLSRTVREEPLLEAAPQQLTLPATSGLPDEGGDEVPVRAARSRARERREQGRAAGRI